MKKVCIILLALLTLSSCAPYLNSEAENNTWQNQYDLGLHYLTIGEYEEAVIAFTAAIEIDPKQAPAYVGRGDAYIGIAEYISDGASENELPEKARAYYQNAIDDYLLAIARNNLDTETYMKAAAIYLALGDTEAAVDLLKQGYAATGDDQILEYVNELENGVFLSEEHEIIETIGRIFLINDVYRDRIDAIMQTYSIENGGIIVRSSNCGVYFNEPVKTEIDGKAVSITEAEFDYSGVIEDTSLLFAWSEGDHGVQVPGELLGQAIILNGYFTPNPQQEEFEGPKFEYVPGDPTENPLYDFRPTGPYVFHLLSYEIP